MCGYGTGVVAAQVEGVSFTGALSLEHASSDLQLVDASRRVDVEREIQAALFHHDVHLPQVQGVLGVEKPLVGYQASCRLAVHIAVDDEVVVQHDIAIALVRRPSHRGNVYVVHLVEFDARAVGGNCSQSGGIEHTDVTGVALA